jgi:hypothetical protein
MSNYCNCTCESQRIDRSTFERVLYAPACDDRIFTDQDDLIDEFDGELVAVYTLSHIARVDVEPEQAVLRIVEIP